MLCTNTLREGEGVSHTATRFGPAIAGWNNNVGCYTSHHSQDKLSWFWLDSNLGKKAGGGGLDPKWTELTQSHLPPLDVGGAERKFVRVD